MLIRQKSQLGMTLVEIMVAIAVVALLFAAAAPNFSSWMQNTRIRNVAESIQSGLHIAKSEAVHRNATTKFISCDASSWAVLASSATAVASGTTLCAGAINLTDGWEIVQSQGIDSASSDINLNFPQGVVAFNGLGRMISTPDDPAGTATPAATAVDLNLSSANATCTCPSGDCGFPVAVSHSTSGTARCLRIKISNGGSFRMCDPALPVNTPQGC
ncbi:MAG: GspH/FimT family pseudopilin [Pseudomonadota bacterium]